MLIHQILKTLKKLLMKKLDAFMQKLYQTQHYVVFPIKEVSDIGRKHNIPLIMDNTASNYMQTS